ncbi:hypothetical protein FNW52_17310 [Flavobacterium sp. ZT3R18]|uniref:hypothetical protein n=1 Tax=Flavobacterium sp. ZT3R18 TaxID=2594429 RepID=UPI001179D39F|nr:hypothetical protein [Flavobacterium sp. ZT3R18]TRX32193.1 hypothetical protein FNW52_17310 [Flavobacterium sp. ZT3R18]
MGVINIFANDFIENASGSIIEDGGEIVNLSEAKVVQNGAKGVDYDKNKDRKPPTDIRITKVEGPFDDKGKIVDKIVLGTFYVYKATTSRKPTVTEIGLLKWSVKFDNGERLIINGVASLNKLDGDKIIIQLVFKHDFEKARIYAFYQKADEDVSVKLNLELKEVIVIIGTEQHSQTYGNKLMFPAQAVREIKQNYSKNKYITLLIFTDGFNTEELKIIERDSKKHNKNATLIKINTVDELIKYINYGNHLIKRDEIKIDVLKIFSHGLPSIIDFGLDGKNSSLQQFNTNNAKQLKSTSFVNKPIVFSYACRTGNSDNSILAYSPTYKYDETSIKLVKPEESLAQILAEQLNATVYAYLRRSNYTPTWVEGSDKEYKKKYSKIEDEEVSNPINPKDWFRTGWDEALWNTEGAYTLPRSGDCPGGILPKGMFKFEKGKKPVLKQ